MNAKNAAKDKTVERRKSLGKDNAAEALPGYALLLVIVEINNTTKKTTEIEVPFKGGGYSVEVQNIIQKNKFNR